MRANDFANSHAVLRGAIKDFEVQVASGTVSNFVNSRYISPKLPSKHEDSCENQNDPESPIAMFPAIFKDYMEHVESEGG